MNGRSLRSPERCRSTDVELTDLDTALERSLERQAVDAGDLQEVLYSIAIPTILLDADLDILFFTPAIKTLFDLGTSNIGRPISDLNSQALDETLLNDARHVLQTRDSIEREISAPGGAWFVRRILPHRARGNRIEGVVVTFTDVTLQKNATVALEQARQQVETANAATAHLLSTASHDLRQPLQALVLLEELLAKVVVGDNAKELLGRFDQALGSMSGMLNALLDINQIEAGTVRAEFETFRIDAVLDRVTTELAYQAKAQRIALQVMPCTLSVRSDPSLLEQMIRNLLAYALKYARRGRILLGCRRRNDRLSIQIWDDGTGTPEDHPLEMFEVRPQLDNSAQDLSLKRGLDLSIVKRLGMLMQHPVTVRSIQGNGAVFTIEVEQSFGGMPARARDGMLRIPGGQLRDAAATTGPTVYVVDGVREVRDAFRSMLEFHGHVVEDFESVKTFIEAFRPDRNACLLVDDNLRGISGLDLLKRLKDAGHPIPVLMVTGRRDVAMAVRAMKAGASDFLEKPVRSVELLASIRRALELSRDAGKLTEWRKDAADHLACLTIRQHQIMEMVLAGHPSKNIAADLGISQRTVENHRASIMKKAGVRSLPALVRLALTAAGSSQIITL